MNAPRPSPGFRLTLALGILVLAFLVLPLLVVVPVSLTPTRYIAMPSGTLSLRHYETLLTDPDWRRGVLDSLFVATGAALLAVALGASAAIGCWRLSNRFGDGLRFLMLAPMIVPPVVHAIGMYRVWVQFGWIDTYLGLVVAHAMKGIPFVVISVSAALANFDHRLEQAARNLGATPFQAVRLAVLPNIWPGTLAGGIFAFAISWDEVVVALFLTSRAVYTLPRKIWDGIQDNVSPSVAAIGVVLIGVTGLLVVIRTFWARHAARQAARALPV